MMHKTRISFLLSLSFCLLSAGLQAQDEQFSSLVRKFEKSGRDMAREKVYLHTDKNFYLAGEIVWFKVYNIDAGTHIPSRLSKTCYVEILDRSKKPVLQAKVELSAKGGAGSFYLPLSINSDNY